MSGFKTYFTKKVQINDLIQLDAQESHHLIKVLRAKKGDSVTAFNGLGSSWSTTLLDPNPKTAVLKIESERPLSPPPCTIILAQAMPKAKGMEHIIQKATEIGVSKIIPIKTARTELKLDDERQEKRIERWRSIAIEACKQSGNLWLPEVAPIQSLKDFLETSQSTNALKLIASLEPNAKPLKQHLHNTAPNTIIWLIGPEGDFTPDEYKMASQFQFLPTSLAKNVLRIETAVTYALSITDYALTN